MTGVTFRWLNSFHQGELLVAHQLANAPKTITGQWGDTAGTIISLVNLREVAGKIARGEELSARITAILNSIVENIPEFPNPDDAGSSPYHGPIPLVLGWQWPPGPPPGPLMVAGELNLYSKLVGGDKEIQAIIDKIVATAAKGAAQTQKAG